VKKVYVGVFVAKCQCSWKGGVSKVVCPVRWDVKKRDYTAIVRRNIKRDVEKNYEL